jgi:hydrogenase small subunit
MNTGGICIGCTMPGFPDAFAPFYKKPPGSMLSTTISRTTGGFISYLRRFTQESRNRTNRWHKSESVPSGWANVEGSPTVAARAVEFFYERLKRMGTEFKPGSSRQKALQAPSHRYLNTRPTWEGTEPRSGAAQSMPEAAE